MRRILCCLIYSLTCCTCPAQQPYKLIDGAAIKLVGTIQLEQRGNNSYLVIQSGKSYEAVFDSDDRRRVREIGISMDGQSKALKALVGQRITVSGVLQLEPVSPYYLNGTLILAKSIRLQNGSVLLPKTEVVVTLPANLTQFQVQVTFSPHASERFTYEAWDSDGHLLPAARDYLSCQLNGPGDVMNCYCADGFAFTGTGEIAGGHLSKFEAPQDGFDFAQFAIDDPVRHYVREAVQCTRKATIAPK
jgi:hypothetical protein